MEDIIYDWEKAILAHVLKEPDTLEEFPLLSEGSPFTGLNLNEYLSCMKAVYKENEASDLAPFKVNTQINARFKQMTGADGRALNGSIKDGRPLSMTGDEIYAHFVNKYQVDKIAMLCGGLSSCDQGKEVATTLIGHLEDSIKQIEDSSVSEVEISNKEAVDEVFEKMAKVNNDSGLVFMKTGIRSLDEVIGGLQKKDVAIFGGAPSMGKTALGLTIACNMTENGFKGAFLSLEMSKVQLMERAMQIRSEANAMAVAKGNIPAHLVAEFMRCSKELAEDDNLIITECKKYDLAHVIASCKRLKKRYPDLDFIVIDYLQLIESNNPRISVGKETIEEASKACTRLAKDLDLAIIPLAQTNRKADDQDPALRDLDGASQMEKDAAIICLISRDLKEQRAAKSEQKSLHDLAARLFVVKNRHGETGIANCTFNAPVTKFKSTELDDGYNEAI